MSRATAGPGPVNGFAAIEDALAALQAGRPVLVLDDEDRENEGDVILAAQTLTTEWLGWAIRHSSGYLCAPITAERADRLDLPLMVERNSDPRRTAYTLACDAATGVTTGISAADRARTLRVLADPSSGPADLNRPGHILPLRARAGGVLERRGHTEAAVDLCRLAGLEPVGAIGELVHDDGSMLRTPDVLALGHAAGLVVITIDELARWRSCHDRVTRTASTRLPTPHGEFRLIGYRDRLTEAEHVALVSPHGLTGADHADPVVRVHSECLTGDVFGSLRCDCGPQLQQSLEKVGRQGGVVVYLRGHEGRGVGLLAKLSAYQLQDAGWDTVDAQTELGLPVDDREYGAAAAILYDLGVTRLDLMTNNPDKVRALRSAGIEVSSVTPSWTPATPDNEFYLRTKRDRMGHHILLDGVPRAGAPDVSRTTVGTPITHDPEEH